MGVCAVYIVFQYFNQNNLNLVVAETLSMTTPAPLVESEVAVSPRPGGLETWLKDVEPPTGTADPSQVVARAVQEGLVERQRQKDIEAIQQQYDRLSLWEHERLDWTDTPRHVLYTYLEQCRSGLREKSKQLNVPDATFITFRTPSCTSNSDGLTSDTLTVSVAPSLYPAATAPIGTGSTCHRALSDEPETHFNGPHGEPLHAPEVIPRTEYLTFEQNERLHHMAEVLEAQVRRDLQLMKRRAFHQAQQVMSVTDQGTVSGGSFKGLQVDKEDEGEDSVTGDSDSDPGSDSDGDTDSVGGSDGPSEEDEQDDEAEGKDKRGARGEGKA